MDEATWIAELREALHSEFGRRAELEVEVCRRATDGVTFRIRVEDGGRDRDLLDGYLRVRVPRWAFDGAERNRALYSMVADEAIRRLRGFQATAL